MADFLHGIETITVNTVGGTIHVVKSAVIGLIGIAPKNEGVAPSVSVTTAETKATATLKVKTLLPSGALVYIHFSTGTGTNIAFTASITSSETSKALCATKIAADFTAITSDYTFAASGDTVTITAAAGLGSSINGVLVSSSAHTSSATLADYLESSVFAGGVNAVTTVTPSSTPQKLTLCFSETDDAKFGKPIAGFNIPKTLQIIRNEAGNTPVVVINVFDSSKHTAAVTNEAVVVASGKFKMAYAPIGTVYMNLANGTTVAPYIRDIDYTIDDYGNGVVINPAITDGTTLKLSYKKLDLSLVTASDIIGAIESNTQTRTGMKLFDYCFNMFGYNAKIFIAPGFTQLAGVANALKIAANKFRGVNIIDAPAGKSISEVLIGRGPLGDIYFNTSDFRTILCYPMVKAYDESVGDNANYWFSAFLAGAGAASDAKNGYWESWSSKEIKSAVGSERFITWNANDTGSEANQLNAAGITTIAQGFGTGVKTWGNRSAAFPSSTDPKTFVCGQRVDDIVSESIELGSVPDIDKPINKAFVDYIESKGNDFIAKLINDGALLPGSKIVFNKELNTASELAAGHIIFDRIYMFPTPAERITFRSILDINLLSSIA